MQVMSSKNRAICSPESIRCDEDVNLFPITEVNALNDASDIKKKERKDLVGVKPQSSHIIFLEDQSSFLGFCKS